MITGGKRMILNLAVLSSLALCAGFGKPGAAADPCLKEVKEIYDAMYNRLPEEGKVYHFNYSITSTLNAKDKDGRHLVSSSDIDLFSSKNQYRFISKDISVYQDRTDKFTVLPAQKMIYWADSDMGLVKGNRLDRMKKIQDTVFYYADVVNCRQGVEGSADKIISVKLQKKFADYMQIRQVVYYVDSKRRELKKLHIEYPETRDVLALDFTFKDSDYDYKKITLSGVRPLFISGKATLTGAYKDYKLIDVRKHNLK